MKTHFISNRQPEKLVYDPRRAFSAGLLQAQVPNPGRAVLCSTSELELESTYPGCFGVAVGLGR